ncbi:hypothetical protein H4582DRAFT_2085159 [Lactarius indigo]|nr:hypothetical protein H4582DRAFT_2085159 [Lactarius indigo]
MSPPSTPETPEASQPRPRVRKVILHVLRPSSDIPVATPGLPPLPLPPPESPLQTPSLPLLPLPPPPSPHLPPVVGPPSQIGDQYSLAGLAMNTPPTYARLGGASYPPVYLPGMHHNPYGLNIGARPFPPWGYPQYPLVPLPGLVPGPVDQNIPRCQDPRVAQRDGGVGTNNATPSSTVSTRLGRTYPNKEVSDGVWRFQTEVVDDHIKHAFTAQTDMIWADFREEVCRCLNRPCSGVRIMFWISGGGHAWSELGSEFDWMDAIAKLKEKARSARTRAVSMEVKDKHAHAKVQNTKGKGKEKHCHEDDIPLAPSPEMQHVACEKHSRPGKRTYCLVESTSGEHKELTHEEMSLWAKQISLENTTVYTPPNLNKYNYPPTKKARTVRATPEVHISVNITPAVGTENPMVQATHQVLTVSMPTPGPSRVACVDRDSSHATPPSVVGPSTQTPPSHILILLDCLAELRVPMVMELLRLMDAQDPAIGLKYVDLEEELTELGITDSVILYSLPISILASFGDLTHDLARRLQHFCYDLFIPLGLVEPRESDDTTEDNSLSQQETEGLLVLKRDKYSLNLLKGENVLPACCALAYKAFAAQQLEEDHLDEVIEVSDDETVVDGVKLDVDGDRATSYEV